MALTLNGDGSVGSLSAAEMGFLDGVTSSVQTQLDSKASKEVAISLASPGYVRFGNGLILQWGVSTSAGQRVGITVTFPIAFPNACLNVQGTVNAGPSFAGKGVSINTTSNSQVEMSHDIAATTNIQWFAVGW